MSPSLGPFEAVIFDMDGTLLDTEAVFRSIVYDVSEELGVTMTDTIHRAMVGSSHAATQTLLVEAYGVSFPYALFDARCRAHMHARMEGAVPVKPGARELIAELRARKVPLAVATSSWAADAARHLDAAGLSPLLDAVVAYDDVARPKPHPEPYLTAARRLAVPPRSCIAFEDSHSGVRAAHAAGMRTIMVPDIVGPTAEIAALCVAVLESLDHARPRLFAAA